MNSFKVLYILCATIYESIMAQSHPINVNRSGIKPNPVKQIVGTWYKPQQDKTNKMMCAQQRLGSAWASAQSDQSSLYASWVAKDPTFLHADSEDPDQTGWMPRLIRVVPGWYESLLAAQVILLVFSCSSSIISTVLHENVMLWVLIKMALPRQF